MLGGVALFYFLPSPVLLAVGFYFIIPQEMICPGIVAFSVFLFAAF